MILNRFVTGPELSSPKVIVTADPPPEFENAVCFALAHRDTDPDHSSSRIVHASFLTMGGHHQEAEEEAWNRFADVGRAVLVGAATVLPHRANANPDRVSAGTCLMAISLLSKLLKKAVPERRPDGENDKSFPSEHAAECTAAAMIIEREYPGRVGAFAYGLAASVAMARIQSKKHHPRDVFAGIAIGTVSVWISLHVRRAVMRRISSIPS